MYKVKITEKALKSLESIDKQIAWIEKNLEGTTDLRAKGKGLYHDKKDILRYQVGNYRILTKIMNDELIILVIEFGHRKDIFK